MSRSRHVGLTMAEIRLRNVDAIRRAAESVAPQPNLNAWRSEIVAATGLSLTSVRRICAAYGIDPKIDALDGMTSICHAAALKAYSELPPSDGKWSWFTAMAAALGVCGGTVERWHAIAGLEPRFRLPSRCRSCGASMTAEWAARNCARTCRRCCVEDGRFGASAS